MDCNNLFGGSNFGQPGVATRTPKSYIELPIKSRYILNIQNYNDNLCFLWSILAYYHPVNIK